MSFTVTNQKTAQAYRNESVIITLNTSDRAQLANMTIGQQCTIPGSKTGYIDFIDTYGYQFRVKPDMPVNSFSSQNTPGYCVSTTVVTVG